MSMDSVSSIGMRPLLIPLVLLTGCDALSSRSRDDEAKAQLVKAELAEVHNLAASKTKTWHAVISKALETKAELSGPCEVSSGEFYPVWIADGVKVPTGFGVSSWTADQQPILAQKVLERVDEIESNVGQGVSADLMLDDIRPLKKPEGWGYDLTLLDLAVEIPEQGNSGVATGGGKVVRALLYSHQDERVVCEGIYQVGTGETISLTYKTYVDFPTPEEPGKLDANMLSQAVRLDLAKKAYYSAGSKMQAVTGRTPLAEQPPIADRVDPSQ